MHVTLGTTIRILENLVDGENHKLFVVDSYWLVTGAPGFSACKQEFQELTTKLEFIR